MSDAVPETMAPQDMVSDQRVDLVVPLDGVLKLRLPNLLHKDAGARPSGRTLKVMGEEFYQDFIVHGRSEGEYVAGIKLPQLAGQTVGVLMTPAFIYGNEE